MYFAVAAVRTLRRGDTWLPVCKGALVMAMAITGITFHLFLAAGDFNMGPTQLITNHLLHTAAPLLTVLDWLLFDEKGHYRRFEPFLWGIFPAAYFVYTMIRARVSSFRFYNGSPYPYPFMDVDALGWGKVLLIFLAMAAAFLALGYVLVWIAHLLARRQKRCPAAGPRPGTWRPPGPLPGRRRPWGARHTMWAASSGTGCWAGRTPTWTSRSTA